MKQTIPFSKFQGTGNDFVIINHTEKEYLDGTDTELIKLMCDRRFGIGADGLMIIEKGNDQVDFIMQYYNSDGNISSMCGNGGRCITLAAKELGLFDKSATFSFQGVLYNASLLDSGNIQLQMQDLYKISKDIDAYVLNTGSPHYVDFMDEVDDLDMKVEGSKIRYNAVYKEKGINVNFCTIRDNYIQVRTYERGVEDETYSCGTGVVASAISFAERSRLADGDHKVSIKTKGGDLQVKLTKTINGYKDIFLIGPAKKVFVGEYINS